MGPLCSRTAQIGAYRKRTVSEYKASMRGSPMKNITAASESAILDSRLQISMARKPTPHRIMGMAMMRKRRKDAPIIGRRRRLTMDHAWPKVIFLPITICETVTDKTPLMSAPPRKVARKRTT